MDTPDRRVVDLAADGVPEIPVLGVNKSLKVRAGAVLHRHADVLEFTLCLRGSVKFDCNGKVYSLLPGEVFLTSPKDVHRLRTNTMGSMVRWIFFRPPKRGGTLPGLLPDETAWLVGRLKSIPAHVFDGTDAIGKARLALMLFAATCMPAAIVAVFSSSAWVAIACIAVVLGAQSCWMANQLTLISESVPRTHAASLLALSAMGGSIGGIAANLLAGRVIAAADYVPVFCVIAFCHLTAFAVLVLTGRASASGRRCA